MNEKKTVHMPAMTIEIDLDSFEPVSIVGLTQEDLVEIVLGAGTWRDTSALKEIELNRLRKELTAARDELSQRQWQPIETAPKDGTRVLAWAHSYLNSTVIMWMGDWYHEGSGTEFGPRHKPTHWMPLPQNPRMNASDGIVETSPQPETRPCCGRPDQCRPAVEFKGESLAEIDNQS